jgi:hypothetical protein
MKTNTFSFQKAPLFSLIIVLSVLMTSCGSYQNSSYYGDGIYGDLGNQDTQRQAPNDSNNRYKSYFSSLQEENQSSEIFTDIDNYNDYQGNGDSTNGTANNYGGWGSNYTQTDIAIYPNNFGMGWGLGFNGWGNPYFNNGFGWNSPFYGGGFGWNNAYYGGGFGWGYPFGFGFGGLGWNNPYFGFNNFYGNQFYGNQFYGGQFYGRNYSNNAGRRGSVNYDSNSNRNLNSRNTNSQINRTYNGRSYSDGSYSRNGSFNSGTRSNTPIFRRGETQNRNSNNPVQGRSNNTRQERSYTPTNSTAPTRSYTPSSNSGRSSGGNYGGGRSGGSSSGRSSGGRGGR